jgi:hypothetical protein
MKMKQEMSTTKIMAFIFGAFFLGMLIVPKSKTETIVKEIPKEIKVNVCEHETVWLEIKSIDEKLYRNTFYRIEYADRITKASFEQSNRNLEVYRANLEQVIKEDEELQIKRLYLLKSLGY